MSGPRQPRQQPLTVRQTALLLLSLMAGLGVMYAVLLVLLALWRLLGWLIWEPAA